MDHNINDIPVDITAALVTGKAPKHSRRERGSNDILDTQNRLSVLIQPALEANRDPTDGLPDFRGKQFGRLTVVAFIGKPTQQTADGKIAGNMYWVVRCQCGRYEVRRNRSVIKSHPDSMCMECKQDIMAREHYDFHKNKREICQIENQK